MIKALITTYFPDTSVVKNASIIKSQVDELFICDNSPVSNEALFAPILDGPNVHYIPYLENLGLSGAFNRVLTDTSLNWNPDDYIVFFDQDSTIEQAHIANLVAEYEALRQAGHNVGCLGPVFFNRSNNTVEIPHQKQPLNDHSYSVGSTITSSLLCTYQTLQEIAFWNEQVFLDMADWDLCWRIMATGKLCCMTDTVVLNHALGNGEKRVGPLRVRVGAPIREYYQTRDCLYLLSKPYAPIKYKIRFLAMLTVRPVLHLLVLDDKKKRFHYIKRGFADFFKHKHAAFSQEK